MIHKDRRWLSVVFVVLFMSLSFLCLYAGHFLLYGEKPVSGNISTTILPEATTARQPSSEKKEPFPVAYKHLSETIGGQPQEIHLLEVDLQDERVEVIPVLSHDKVYGFEKLSDIASRSGAFAAVNGGFFHPYGEPGGMVMVNGEILIKSTGKYPVLITGGGKAELRELETRLWVQAVGKDVDVGRINEKGLPGEIALYTPFFGSSNRAAGENITAVIVDGIVQKVAVFSGEVSIPDQGMLLSVLLPSEYTIRDFPVKQGDAVKLGSKPAFPADTHAYECGSWIVKEGKVVIENTDEWIGVTTNQDPRTVAGIKDGHTVVLLTVDGRQPGYSAGLTGKELGALLLRLGIHNAAMLDGGASTEMIAEGKMVNRPSNKGQERPLAGALAVRMK